jgi:hypothetical protein
MDVGANAEGQVWIVGQARAANPRFRRQGDDR